MEDKDKNPIRGQSFILSRKIQTLDQSKTLFEHQFQAIESFKKTKTSGVFYLPTGSGKTRIAIEIAALLLNEDEEHRIIWVSYPTILITQAMSRFKEYSALFKPFTYYMWKKTETALSDIDRKSLFKNHIIFTLREDFTNMIKQINNSKITSPFFELLRKKSKGNEKAVTVFYDECHQMGATGLQKALKQLKDENHDIFNCIRFIGLSATPVPENIEKRIFLEKSIFPPQNDEDQKWNLSIHAEASVESLLKEKVLCPFEESLSEVFEISLNKMQQFTHQISTHGKSKDIIEKNINNSIFKDDFFINELGEKIALNLDILGKTLIFTPTISSANKLAQAIDSNLKHPGRVVCVHSEIEDYFSDAPKKVDSNSITNKIIDAFRLRKNENCVIVNVNMLTAGFDDPTIQTIILARITFSKNLFWQMIGRGRRGVKCGGTYYCNLISPLIAYDENFQNLYEYEPRQIEKTPPQISFPLIQKAYSSGTLDISKLSEQNKNKIATLIENFLNGYSDQFENEWNDLKKDITIKIVDKLNIIYFVLEDNKLNLRTKENNTISANEHLLQKHQQKIANPTNQQQQQQQRLNARKRKKKQRYKEQLNNLNNTAMRELRKYFHWVINKQILNKADISAFIEKNNNIYFSTDNFINLKNLFEHLLFRIQQNLFFTYENLNDIIITQKDNHDLSYSNEDEYYLYFRSNKKDLSLKKHDFCNLIMELQQTLIRIFEEYSSS